MDSEIAKTVKQLYDEYKQNDRRSVYIRQTTEANAESQNGTAGLLIPLDGMMVSISELKFKLVFNDGFAVGTNQSGGAPHVKVVDNGANTYPTLASWKAAFPLGSVVLADNLYGAQCWDYAAGFWKAQVGRTLSTGVYANGESTGMVAHSYDWADVRAYNMGTTFQDMGNTWTNIKAGDWLFWDTGTWGHVAMAVEDYQSSHPEYIMVWNQNGASGVPYPAGGKNLAEDKGYRTGFIGALRYRPWH